MECREWAKKHFSYHIFYAGTSCYLTARQTQTPPVSSPSLLQSCHFQAETNFSSLARYTLWRRRWWKPFERGGTWRVGWRLPRLVIMHLNIYSKQILYLSQSCNLNANMEETSPPSLRSSLKIPIHTDTHSSDYKGEVSDYQAAITFTCPRSTGSLSKHCCLLQVDSSSCWKFKDKSLLRVYMIRNRHCYVETATQNSAW